MNDAPQPGQFDWGGLFCNILAGVAAVAVVAVALTGVGVLAVGAGIMAASTASAMVTGAVVGGLVSVGACAVGNLLSGEVSSMGDYVFSGFSGAVTGAIFSGIGGSKAFLGLKNIIQNKGLLRLVRAGIMAGTEFVTGAGTNVGYQLWNGKSWDEISWDEVLTTGAFNSVTLGLFYWGSDRLLQFKPIQQFINKLNKLPIFEKMVGYQTRLTNFFQNNGARISAFINGGVSKILTVFQLQGQAMQWWKDDYSPKLNAKIRGKINKVSVAFDPKSGTYYYGVNREYLGLGIHDAQISMLWLDESLNRFPIGNCAENSAIYRAIQGGAQLDDLYLCTVTLNRNNYGSIINACENCTYALKGAVADNLSGWVVDWQSNIIASLSGAKTGMEAQMHD